jgi:hypothetical protein
MLLTIKMQEEFVAWEGDRFISVNETIGHQSTLNP